MKNTVFAIIGIIVFFIGLFPFVACKKAYTCRCEYIANGTYHVSEYEFLKGIKVDAKTACNVMEYDLQNTDSVAFAKCTFGGSF